MSFDHIYECLTQIPQNGAIMGLDLGTKTIGVAVSDIDQTVATGIKTINRIKFQTDLKELKFIIAHRDIKGVILGLPKNMSGTEGPRCQSIRAFAKNMAPAIAIPISFWDERLSTVAAERSLLEANASRKKRSEVIDYVAAAFILQGALDRLSVLKRGRNFD